MITELQALRARFQNEQTDIGDSIRGSMARNSVFDQFPEFDIRDRRNQNDRFIAALYAAIRALQSPTVPSHAPLQS
ncbi:MAG: hypothetical protein Fur0032_20870 [Terrimicrobiaceae bacterium]